MNTVYLAGPIDGRTDAECNNWRSEARRLLAFRCRILDPMARDYRGRTAGNEAEIVRGDKRDIDESDCLVVWFDRPSVGTAMEILYAWERGKAAYIVNASCRPPSPWLVHHGTIVDTLAEACRRATT